MRQRKSAAGKKKKLLTPMQARFVDAYLQSLSGAEAAIAAGYSQKTARQSAYQALTSIDVRAEIDRRLKEHAMPANEVLARLTRQARGELESSRSEGPKGTTTTYDAQHALELLAKHHKLLSDEVNLHTHLTIQDYEKAVEKAYGNAGK